VRPSFRFFCRSSKLLPKGASTSRPDHAGVVIHHLHQGGCAPPARSSGLGATSSASLVAGGDGHPTARHSPGFSSRPADRPDDIERHLPIGGTQRQHLRLAALGRPFLNHAPSAAPSGTGP